MDGILVVDKPQGWTSHDVVNFIRRRFKIKKAGHSGTLDPMATGILIVLLGGYTKFSNEFMDSAKEYKAVLTLGTSTDTQDSTGNVIKTQSVPELKKEDIEKALEGFKGQIEQVPPMFSAIKFKGQRLYKLARQGVRIQRSMRKVNITALCLEKFEPPHIWLSVTCNKGTYIRTLCEDVASSLGCLGHMSYLRRTRSGGFSINQAVSIERLKEIQTEDLKSLVLQTLASKIAPSPSPSPLWGEGRGEGD
jgi:tRNA pseudouridine55 synthase